MGMSSCASHPRFVTTTTCFLFWQKNSIASLTQHFREEQAVTFDLADATYHCRGRKSKKTRIFLQMLRVSKLLPKLGWRVVEGARRAAV